MGQPRFLFLSRTLETGSGTGDRKKVQGLAQTYFWLELKCWQALRKNGIKWRNFFVYQYNGDSATRDYEAVSDGTPPPSRSLRYIRSEEHTSELQSLAYLVCRLLLE